MVPETKRKGGLEEERERLLTLFANTRTRTEGLAARLSPEDQQLQSMPEASPTKWHRGHTTWFFETFVLEPAGTRAVDGRYAFLFNSYYETEGPRLARPRRGVLSRPSALEIADYRRIVDERMTALLANASEEALARILPVVELGIAHEEQHQELLLTDILHAFSENPLLPAFQSTPSAASAPSTRAERAPRFVRFEGGLSEIGASQRERFAFDNEKPRHKQWVDPFDLADRLVTVGELKAFLRDRGYRTPSLWLSEGLDFARANDLRAPLYSTYEDGELHVFTLGGARVASDDEPITHLSYYEADALARFLGARLPTEAEWEIAAAKGAVRGNFLDDAILRPLPPGAPSNETNTLTQLFGDAWEWTQSSYEPYPGYRPAEGALGEYNGKFMVNQRVLRGGSCLTPRRHVRASYRNFWPAHTRFQMAGLRLAREAS